MKPVLMKRSLPTYKKKKKVFVNNVHILPTRRLSCDSVTVINFLYYSEVVKITRTKFVVGSSASYGARFSETKTILTIFTLRQINDSHIYIYI